MALLRKKGVFTGSRLFGVAHAKSDYDYLLTREEFDKYFHDTIGYITYDGADYNQPNFQSFQLRTKAGLYNLIVLWKDSEYEAWCKATQFTNALPTWLIVDKGIRTSIFEYAKQAAREGKI